MTIGLLWYGMPFPASGCVWLWDFGFKTSLDNYLSCLLQQGCTQQRLVCRVASPSKTIVSFHLCKEVLGGPLNIHLGILESFRSCSESLQRPVRLAGAFASAPKPWSSGSILAQTKTKKNKLYIYIIMKKISEFAVCCMCVCVCVCTARVSIITVNTYPHDHVQYIVLRICKCIYLNI